jgi:endo-1,4-beta-xylanase
MLRRFVATSFIIVFILSTCTPKTSLISTSTPAIASPTPIPATATATLQPTTTLKQVTGLYTGPGNENFELTATLSAGQTVTPLATYGEFVQAVATVDSQEKTGFLWKGALDTLPSKLPVITRDQAPLVLLYQPRCSIGMYDPTLDQVTFENTSANGDDNQNIAMPLTSPLRIRVKGMSVKGGGFAAIKILGITDPAVGEWWQGITRMDLGYNQGFYFLAFRDGTTADYKVMINLPINAYKGMQIKFDQPEGKSFHVLDENGKEVQFVDLTQTSGLNLPNGLFPNGVIYIGTTLLPHSSFTVTGMQIGVQPTGKWIDPQDGYYSQPGLASLAAPHGITIGTEFRADLTSNQRYCQIMQRDFNVAVLSGFSSPAIWLGPGQYDFRSLDKDVAYARQHGWRIRASHLLAGDGATLPDWLKNGKYSRDELIQLMEQYIRDVVERYKGRVQEWSIANEAANRSASPGADFWNDHIGQEYIALAFKTARETDPNGILIFNNDNNQAPQDAYTANLIDKLYATVKQLKAESVPVDVLGMEMHLFLPWNSQVPPDQAAVTATMQKFGALGVRIYITEFDVDLAHRTGTQADKLNLETKIYSEMIKACLESGVCDSFATWGISDSISWLTCNEDWCVEKNNSAAPLMFDFDNNPKPAYFAVRDALLTDFTLVPTAIP